MVMVLGFRGRGASLLAALPLLSACFDPDGTVDASGSPATAGTQAEGSNGTDISGPPSSSTTSTASNDVGDPRASSTTHASGASDTDSGTATLQDPPHVSTETASSEQDSTSTTSDSPTTDNGTMDDSGPRGETGETTDAGSTTGTGTREETGAIAETGSTTGTEPTSPGYIDCGGSMCLAGGNICCHNLTQGTWSCASPAESCGSSVSGGDQRLRMACDDNSDCPATQVCCSHRRYVDKETLCLLPTDCVNMPGTQYSTSRRFVCDAAFGSADCPESTTCQPSSDNFDDYPATLHVCLN